MSSPPPQSDRSPFRRVGAAAAELPAPFAATSWGRLTLILASVVMLSLAFAPFKQFYLAWIGLAPWLLLVAHVRSRKAAFFWSLLFGFAFAACNIYWLCGVTFPGAVGLMVYIALWVGVAGLVLYTGGILNGPDVAQPQPAWRPILSITLIAAVWVAQEWFRGWFLTGMPWSYLGHTQTPILIMCQIADFASAYGVTFWVVLINAWVAQLFLHRLSVVKLLLPGAIVLLVVAGTLFYGIFRFGQRTTYPGPTVMVVQPNFKQDPTGRKGASPDELIRFHFDTTQAALDAQRIAKAPIDLVAWSETMLPPLNAEYRKYAHGFVRQSDKTNLGRHLDALHARLGEFTRTYNVNLVFGSHASLPDKSPDVREDRNSAYLFDRAGQEVPLRYDKIHLVPFGEFIPFKESVPPLYRFFNFFNPNEAGGNNLQPGRDLIIFPLAPATTVPTTGPSSSAVSYRFAPAICFEDVDSRLIAGQFAGPDRSKRADFIINLTNDGWFIGGQMAQHLQLATFRSIENRVPTARSVNTGISGFIDSMGRVHDTLPVHSTGTSVARLELDRRVAPYTHLGDAFAGICLVTTGGLCAWTVWNGMKNRKSAGR